MYDNSDIIKRQQEHRDHILKGFMLEAPETTGNSIFMSKEQFFKAKTEFDLEVYTEDALNQFKVNLRKASVDGHISPSGLQKAESDLSKLVKIIITDVEKAKTVYIKKGGEGSRGGKVIGHNKSGEPIYESKEGKKITTNTPKISDFKTSKQLHDRADKLKEKLTEMEDDEDHYSRKELDDAEDAYTNARGKAYKREEEEEESSKKKEPTAKDKETMEKIKDQSKKEGISKNNK